MVVIDAVELDSASNVLVTPVASFSVVASASLINVAVVVVIPLAATTIFVSAEIIWFVSAPTMVWPVELTVREFMAVNISRMPAVVRL